MFCVSISVLSRLVKDLNYENRYKMPFVSTILKIKEPILNNTQLMNSFLECHSKTQSLDVVRLAGQTKTGSACWTFAPEKHWELYGFFSPFLSACSTHTARSHTPAFVLWISNFFQRRWLNIPGSDRLHGTIWMSPLLKNPVPFTYSTHRQRHAYI